MSNTVALIRTIIAIYGSHFRLERNAVVLEYGPNMERIKAMCVANVNGPCFNFAYGPNTERALRNITSGKCELPMPKVRTFRTDPSVSFLTDRHL